MKRLTMYSALAAALATPRVGTFVTMDEGAQTSEDSGGSAPAPTPSAPKAPKKAKPAKKAAAKKPAKKKAAGKSGSSKGLTGPAVLKAYAPQYKKGGKDGKQKTASGNQTIDCGDKLADQLRGMDLDAVYDKAVKVLNTALEEGEKPHTKQSLVAKYKGLNVGMQRMNLGNRMRAILFPKK